MDFEIIGTVRNAETMVSGRGIRDLHRLNRSYGRGNWRKRKGDATVRLAAGSILEAEVHWYEAHGIGRVDMKIKRYL